MRNVGAEARGARRAGARLATAGSLQWVESNEVAGKFLPLWPPSPPSLSFFFFFTSKKDNGFRKEKECFLSPLSAPSPLYSYSVFPGSPQVSCVPVKTAREQHWKPQGKAPFATCSWTEKQGRTSPKPTSAPCAWDTHDRPLRPQVGVVWSCLKQFPHANSYGENGEVDMKNHLVLKFPPPQ